jgi:hypothetical protein
MKHRAVMPDVKGVSGGVFRDITLNPGHLLTPVAEALLGLHEGRARNIEYSEIPIARLQQVVNECRGAAADIYDAGGSIQAGIGNQGE